MRLSNLGLGLMMIAMILTSLCLGTTTDQELNFKIDGSAALEIVENEPDAVVFIEENFFNESERITSVQLAWIPDTNEYTWEVKITERECGCRGIEGLNVLEAEVDPNSGEINELQTRVGVDQDQLARETCEKGCHR
jgi:hypothetical protein